MTTPAPRILRPGLDVGLPDGQMGQLEVGHTNIGAGRVVYQEPTRISSDIQEGVFFQNVEIGKAVDAAVKTKGQGRAHHGSDVPGWRTQPRRAHHGHDRDGRQAWRRRRSFTPSWMAATSRRAVPSPSIELFDALFAKLGKGRSPP